VEEHIGFAEFDDSAGGADDVAIGEVRFCDRPAVNSRNDLFAGDVLQPEAGVGHVHQGIAPVVGDIKVKKAVAINICEREGGGSFTEVHAAEQFEMRFAVIDEDVRSFSHRVNDEIEVAIAIDVGERGPRRIGIGHGDAGRCCDILELPIPEIAIEDIRSVQGTKVEIAPAVTVDIAGGNARSVEQDLVGKMACFG